MPGERHFGAGAPELALAGGLAGLFLWRKLWRGEPDPSIDLGRGLVFGALYGLLVIPFGLFGLYLRTGPRDVPAVVQPFFALIVALVGSGWAIIVPQVWITALLLGTLSGAVSALVADYLKLRLPP